MQQQQPRNSDAGEALIICILRGAAFTGTSYLRKPGTIGPDAYPAFVCFFSLALMAIWGYFWASEYLQHPTPQYEIGPLVLFALGWCLMNGVHLIARGIRDGWGGYPPLTYTGTPWLRWGNWDEEKIKEKLEPIVLIIGGLGMCAWNIPLGTWLSIAGFCLGISISLNNRRRKRWVRELDDMMERQLEHLGDRRRWGRGW